ncbi:MAG: GNAT family N-acetyltransferase [bacterium]|nr:GNAT family N-acetyltransferase [bacterium]
MITDTHIFLRRAERADLDTILVWLDDPAFLTFLHGDPSKAPKQVRERLGAMVASASTPMLSGGGFYMMDSEDAGTVGLVSFHDLSWRNRLCTFDVYVAPDALAAGLDETCLDFALRYSFGEMNLHRVARLVPASNVRAVRLMEDAGARREAVLRGHFMRDGEPEDAFSFGILRSEFMGQEDAAVAEGGGE